MRAHVAHGDTRTVGGHEKKHHDQQWTHYKRVCDAARAPTMKLLKDGPLALSGSSQSCAYGQCWHTRCTHVHGRGTHVQEALHAAAGVFRARACSHFALCTHKHGAQRGGCGR